MYFNAIKYGIGSPPAAPLIISIAFASASAILSRDCASPSALIIRESASPRARNTCDSCIPSASKIAALLVPSASKIIARRSRSARICFSIAWRMSAGGVTSCNSTRFTLTPHLSVASSKIMRNFSLMLSRDTSVSSKSIEPIMLRKVVCANFSIASVRFKTSYTAAFGLVI